MLVSTGSDTTVRLWDAATGRELRQLTGVEKSWFSSVAFAPDGRLVAADSSLSHDTTAHLIYLWDAATGKLLHRLVGHDKLVQAVAFSPDGQLLLSASWDNTLALWGPVTGKEVRRLKGHTKGVRTAAFSPDGRLLASAGQDGTVRLWEVQTGSEIRTLEAWASSLVFSPDGRMLASVNGLLWNNVEPDNKIRLWDVLTGEPVARLAGHPDGVSLLLFSPDGKVLVSGSDDSTLLSWDVSAYQKDRRLREKELPREAFEVCWRTLGEKDGASAYRAIEKLAAAPRQAPLLLREPLRSAKGEKRQRIGELMKQFDDEDFATREKASDSLARLGPSAEPALRKVLADALTPEVRRRVQRLLAKLETAQPDAEQLRTVRAIAALEYAGGVESRKLLEELAQGDYGAVALREAKAALERGSRQRNAPP